MVVAPDVGAVPLAERYARRLGLPLAIVHKTRLSGERVRVEGLTGDVRGRTTVLVDDLISTGGTVVAAAEVLLEAGARPAFTVVASHALLVGGAAVRLRELPLARLVITDSVVPPADPPGPLEVVTLGPLLVEVIARLHGERSVRDLVGRA